MRLYLKVRPIVDPVVIAVDVDASDAREAVHEAFANRREIATQFDWADLCAREGIHPEVVEVSSSLPPYWPQMAAILDVTHAEVRPQA